MANVIRLDLTDQETAALVNLIDLAVKAGGLNVAQNALIFVSKIQIAQREAQMLHNVKPLSAVEAKGE